VHAVRFSQLLSSPFLAALETQIFVNNPRNWNFFDCSVAPSFVFLAQQQRLKLRWRFNPYAHCVCCCPDACRLFRTFSTSSAADIGSLLMLFFVQPLSGKSVIITNYRAL